MVEVYLMFSQRLSHHARSILHSGIRTVALMMANAFVLMRWIFIEPLLRVRGVDGNLSRACQRLQ